MGILDKLRPQSKSTHPDPNIRIEAIHELDPRVLEVLLLGQLLTREEELRLDLHQVRGHDEELSAGVRIDVLEKV